MPQIGPGPSAALTVVSSAVSGLVTNLLTDQWSWSLAVGLFALVTIGAALAWWDRVVTAAPAPRRTSVRQVATKGSRIHNSRIKAQRGAQVNEAARDNAAIADSTITARGANVDRATEDGSITDSHITTD